MSNIIAGIIGGTSGAIVGAICSGWIAWLIAKKNIERTQLASLALNRIQERRKAAANFRLAFLELLLLLKEDIEPKGFTNLHSYLVAMYPKHAAAITTFIPYLDKTRVERINKAWFDYKYPNGIAKGEEHKEAFPLQDYAQMSEPKTVALNKIENLLSVCDHNF